MKEKMAKFLKELYSDLGLPENVLKSVANFAIIGLKDDASDDEIKSRAQEESVKSMLQDFQAHADKRATDATKAAEKKNKKDVKKPGEGEGNDDHDDDDDDDKTPKWVKELMEQNQQTIKTLTEKIEALENTNKAKSFDDLVSTVAKELGLSGAVLDLCKASLSTDMDETAIRNKLGEAKKVLLDSGAQIAGTGTKETQTEAAKEEQARKDADEWVTQQEKLQQAQQQQ